MEWLDFIILVVTDESKHFLFSAAWGSVGFLLTWTILSVLYFILGLPKKLPVAVYGILICSLLVGLSFALQAHWLLDYLSTWYVTPLGPPLDLN